MKYVMLMCCLGLMVGWSTSLVAAPKKATTAKHAKSDPKPIVKYKKNDRIDLEDIMVEGETSGNPGDLSITPMLNRENRNELPRRDNFNPEIRTGIEVVN